MKPSLVMPVIASNQWHLWFSVCLSVCLLSKRKRARAIINLSRHRVHDSCLACTDPEV